MREKGVNEASSQNAIEGVDSELDVFQAFIKHNGGYKGAGSIAAVVCDAGKESNDVETGNEAPTNGRQLPVRKHCQQTTLHFRIVANPRATSANHAALLYCPRERIQDLFRSQCHRTSQWLRTSELIGSERQL
jgi:hypothetical protein